MDFDSSCLADPALDVGYFLADWQFRQADLDDRRKDEMYESFLAGYVPRAPKDFLIRVRLCEAVELVKCAVRRVQLFEDDWASRTDRKSTRLNSSHTVISYAVFCLKKKKK